MIVRWCGLHEVRPGDGELARDAGPDAEAHGGPRHPKLWPHARHAAHGEAHAGRHAHHLATWHPKAYQLLSS